jgi:hypothetical protein
MITLIILGYLGMGLLTSLGFLTYAKWHRWDGENSAIVTVLSFFFWPIALIIAFIALIAVFLVNLMGTASDKIVTRYRTSDSRFR